MKDLLLKVKDYIDNNYIEEIPFSHELPSCSRIIKRNNSIINLEDDFFDEDDSLEIRSSCSKRSSFDIKNKFFNVEETWQQALFKWIDDKELKDPDVYKRANISKQTFSKIRGDINYQPNKDTSIQLCIGLKLNIDDSLDLLRKAGYSLSNSIKRDLVVKYFIENKIFNIDELNLVLDELELKLFPIN